MLIEGPDLYDGVDVEPVATDVEIDLGETRFRPIHTPGHSLGHLAFELPARNEVVTGDAILPVYTPNVGGTDVRVKEPLAHYLRTLDRIASASFDRAWPGHRDPIHDPTFRAREIITHHKDRAMQVVRTLDEVGPATSWEVSQRLFGSLDDIHILHGPGEAYAHLDHLERAGEAERTVNGYRLTADATERLRIRDTDNWPLEF